MITGKRAWLFGTLVMIVAGMADVTAAGPSSGNEGGHGGDVFDVSASGQGYQFWDVVEYGDAFHPSDLPEYVLIAKQFEIVKAKAPKTGAFLEFIMRNGGLWSFVDPKLQELPPTGNSKLIITYNKVQAAITDVGTKTIQINRAIWNELPPRSRAFLLVHEALWIAEKSDLAFRYIDPKFMLVRTLAERPCPGADAPSEWNTLNEGYTLWVGETRDVKRTLINLDDISTTSANIRAMTGFLMNPSLNEYSLEGVANILGSNTGRVNCHSWGKFLGAWVVWISLIDPARTALGVLLEKDLKGAEPVLPPPPPTSQPINEPKEELDVRLKFEGRVPSGFFDRHRAIKIAREKCEAYLNSFDVSIRSNYRCSEDIDWNWMCFKDLSVTRCYSRII